MARSKMTKTFLPGDMGRYCHPCPDVLDDCHPEGGLKVYEPRVRPGYEWALPVDDGDHEKLWALDATPRSATWRPMPVERLTVDEDGDPLVEADLPWLGGHVLVLRERAAEALSPLLGPYGEFLPLSCPDIPLWLFHNMTVVDALDEDRSSIVRFDDGDILEVTRHEFRAGEVAGLPVFKVPQLLRGPLFLGESFAAALATAGLTGPVLKQVWP